MALIAVLKVAALSPARQSRAWLWARFARGRMKTGLLTGGTRGTVRERKKKRRKRARGMVGCWWAEGLARVRGGGRRGELGWPGRRFYPFF